MAFKAMWLAKLPQGESSRRIELRTEPGSPPAFKGLEEEEPAAKREDCK